MYSRIMRLSILISIISKEISICIIYSSKKLFSNSKNRIINSIKPTKQMDSASVIITLDYATKNLVKYKKQ